MPKTKILTVKVNEQDIQIIDKIIKSKISLNMSRSEVIRNAIRDYIIKEMNLIEVYNKTFLKSFDKLVEEVENELI